MAEAEVRMLTEGEAYAIAAAQVQRETAEIQSQLDTKTSEIADLQSRLDVETAARVAAEQAAEAARTEHQEFVAKLEADREAAAKKDERLVAAREAASHLDETFFADEKRVGRIVAMTDEAFEGYLADLRETAKAAPPKAETPPRETAMSGAPVAGGGSVGSALRSFFVASDASKEG
jgi:hypothetical protein